MIDMLKFQAYEMTSILISIVIAYVFYGRRHYWQRNIEKFEETILHYVPTHKETLVSHKGNYFMLWRYWMNSLVI